ncbi:hypothetical protein O1611_g3335 [Lasiodiplodia mahajangana]|uniref:Uncharacterized protein n=1 Tax=Lasiodiplodia mahajangana TaxID=1108764 RepID=A0ACC2JS94_9PEZI|nr:hypothetical protein O1611_g3335 [Lasiodiplodia mahajangana]
MAYNNDWLYPHSLEDTFNHYGTANLPLSAVNEVDIVGELGDPHFLSLPYRAGPPPAIGHTPLGDYTITDPMGIEAARCYETLNPGTFGFQYRPHLVPAGIGSQRSIHCNSQDTYNETNLWGIYQQVAYSPDPRYNTTIQQYNRPAKQVK